MATFRATIKGTGGPASRLGHRHIMAEINGWNIGITVKATKTEFDTVKFEVFLTGGTNGGEYKKIAETEGNA